MRRAKYFPPEERRFVANNVQCTLCGNTSYFSINLRLRHNLDVDRDGTLIVALDERLTRRVFQSIAGNIERMLEVTRETGREIFHCANCGEADTLETQQNLLEWCFERGCPGCEVCGQFISEEEVRELCTTCIREHAGRIEEDDCTYCCPYYDDGLGQVLEHYNLSVDRLKQEIDD